MKEMKRYWQWPGSCFVVRVGRNRKTVPVLFTLHNSEYNDTPISRKDAATIMRAVRIEARKRSETPYGKAV